MVDFVSMGLMLALARTSKHISQEAAAEMAKVSVDTVRNIEHGNTIPHMETVFALWDIYGLPENDIWNYYFRDKSTNERLTELGIDTAHPTEKKLLKI